MYKSFFSKSTLLLMFGSVFALLFWFYLDTQKKSITPAELSPISTTAPSSFKQPAEVRSTEATLAIQSKKTSQPLNLEIEPLKNPLGNQPSNDQIVTPLLEGPSRPALPPLQDTPTNTSLLPDRFPPSENGVVYGYEGKEKESHKVTIGIKQDDVTVKTQIKAGEKESEVQGLEIEIKLPK